MPLFEARERRHLPPAESALLLALRVEVDGLRQGVDCLPHVRAILQTMNCPQADRALTDFVASLAAPGAATRSLAIYSVSRPLISPDERLLLDVVALQQQARSLESMMMLRAIWCDDLAIRDIQETAVRLALMLRKAGQRLLAPEDQTRLSAWSGSHAAAGLGATVPESLTSTSPNG